MESVVRDVDGGLAGICIGVEGQGGEEEEGVLRLDDLEYTRAGPIGNRPALSKVARKLLKPRCPQVSFSFLPLCARRTSEQVSNLPHKAAEGHRAERGLRNSKSAVA